MKLLRYFLIVIIVSLFIPPSSAADKAKAEKTYDKVIIEKLKSVNHEITYEMKEQLLKNREMYKKENTLIPLESGEAFSADQVEAAAKTAGAGFVLFEMGANLDKKECVVITIYDENLHPVIYLEKGIYCCYQVSGK